MIRIMLNQLHTNVWAVFRELLSLTQEDSSFILFWKVNGLRPPTTVGSLSNEAPSCWSQGRSLIGIAHSGEAIIAIRCVHVRTMRATLIKVLCVIQWYMLSGLVHACMTTGL